MYARPRARSVVEYELRLAVLVLTVVALVLVVWALEAA